MYALSAHVLTTNMPLKECASVLLQLEEMLSEKYRIGHSTIQFECDEHQGKCSEIDGLYCQMEETHDHAHEQVSPTKQTERMISQ
jgi:cobalt-zinc-cadmium efflux system protein